MTQQTEYSAQSFIVNVDGAYIGLAVTVPNGLRFLTCDPRYLILDGSQFRRADQLYQAVRTLSQVIYADNLPTLQHPTLADPANDIIPAKTGIASL